MEARIKGLGYFFLFLNFYSLEALEGSLPHNHVEKSRRVAEHTSYPLEYQSFVKTPVQQTRQICCRLKNLAYK